MPKNFTSEDVDRLYDKRPDWMKDKTKHDMFESLSERGNTYEFNPKKMVSNIPASVVGQIGQSVKGLANIPGTVVGIAKGEVKPEQLWEGLKDYGKETYGSKENFLYALETDPFRIVNDLATIPQGIGGAAKIGGKIAVKAGVRGASNAVKIAQNISDVGNAMEASKMASWTIKGTGKVLGINKKLSKTADAIGDALYREGYGLKGKEDEILRNAGLPKGNPPQKWLRDHGLRGTPQEMSNQLGQIVKDSAKAKSDILSGMNGTFRSTPAHAIMSEMDKTYEKFQRVHKSLPPQDRQLWQGIKLLKEKEFLTPKELDFVRSLWDSEKFKMLYKTSGDPKTDFASGILVRQGNELRGQIYKIADVQGKGKDLREINGQIRASKAFKPHFDKLSNESSARFTQLTNHPYLAYTLLGGGVGMFTGSVQTGAAAAGTFMAADMALKSPTVASFLGTRLSLLSKGDYDALMEAGRKQRWTSKIRGIAENIGRETRKAFPALKLFEESVTRGESRTF
jgi:hypothetical protein